VPKALREHVTQETFDKAQAYGRDKAKFGFVETVFNLAQNTLSIVYDFLPWLWNFSGDIMLKLAGYGSEYEVRVRSLVLLKHVN
jgi:STE24 endopeptidase